MPGNPDDDDEDLPDAGGDDDDEDDDDEQEEPPQTVPDPPEDDDDDEDEDPTPDEEDPEEVPDEDDDPEPPKLPTGPDYTSGVVYDNDGNVIELMPVRIMTRGEDQRQFIYTPLLENYHRPDAAYDRAQLTPNQVNDAYRATFEADDNFFATYLEYPYFSSILVTSEVLKKSGPCFKFTSPFTGLSYSGVLPFFFIEVNGRKFAWFIEIYNDYQGYRSLDRWDPVKDGPPRLDTATGTELETFYGWMEVRDEFVYYKQVPPGVTTALPKQITASNASWKMGPFGHPTATTHSTYAWAHFVFDMFPNQVGTSLNGRRFAHDFVYARLSGRDPNPPAEFSKLIENNEYVSYWSKPTIKKGARGPMTGNEFINGMGASLANWDGWYTSSDLPLATTTGPMPYYQRFPLGSDNTVLTLLKATNAMSFTRLRPAGQNYEDVWYFTRDTLTRTFENFGGITPNVDIRTASRYLFNKPRPYDFYDSDYLSVPNSDRTFAGIAWDGTGAGGEIMHNGYGFTTWLGDVYVDKTACGSFNADPRKEFGGVLALAKNTVKAATGRRQCPFTWHSTLGYIEWHVSM